MCEVLMNTLYTSRSLDNVAGTVKYLGFDSWKGQEILLFHNTGRLILGPTQSPIPWVNWLLFSRVKRTRPKADHSPQSGGKVKHYSDIRLHVVHGDNLRSPFNVTNKDPLF